MSNDILNTINVEEITHSDILVVGVGGAGGNALNNMIASGIHNVTFMACNTDKDALENSNAELRLQLGPNGDGAGSNPEKGRNLATESLSDIFEMLRTTEAKIIFFTAGMGGGTGTGATPVIARAARELHEQAIKKDDSSQGILTVAVVTTPFTNEGPVRVKQAKEGIEELRKYVDAILIINNDSLINLCGDLPQGQAMKFLDGILTDAVKGMAEIITLYGDVNIDIADANTCLRGGGNVLMCTGRASGLERAKEAVEQCFQSPLLENRNICGARQILLDIHSSSKHPLTMKESDLIRSLLQEKAGGKANLIWGNCTKEELDEDLEIVVVASQFSSVSLETKVDEAPEEKGPQPPSEDKRMGLPDESQTVVRYRGKDRYSKMDEIYKVPAFKRYSDIFDSALSTPAPKKSIVDDSIEPTASESKMSSEDSSLSLF